MQCKCCTESLVDWSRKKLGLHNLTRILQSSGEQKSSRQWELGSWAPVAMDAFRLILVSTWEVMGPSPHAVLWTWISKHQAGLEVLCGTDSSGFDHFMLWLLEKMGKKWPKWRRAKIHVTKYTKYILFTLNMPWKRNFKKSIFVICKNFAFERMWQLLLASPILKVKQMKAVLPAASVISRVVQ